MHEYKKLLDYAGNKTFYEKFSNRLSGIFLKKWLFNINEGKFTVEGHEIDYSFFSKGLIMDFFSKCGCCCFHVFVRPARHGVFGPRRLFVVSGWDFCEKNGGGEFFAFPIALFPGPLRGARVGGGSGPGSGPVGGTATSSGRARVRPRMRSRMNAGTQYVCRAAMYLSLDVTAAAQSSM